MANKQIYQLDETTTLANGDVFAVDKATGNLTRKITKEKSQDSTWS